MRDISDDAAKRLATAIIRPVVREYKQAINRLHKYPNSETARRQVLELRDFFLSDWFSTISLGMDGETMIRSIEIMAEKEREIKRRKKQGL